MLERNKPKVNGPSTYPTWTITFQVPCGGYTGVTRLRVRGGYNNPVTTGQSCNALGQTYGNTVDFNITIAASSNPSANYSLPKDTIFENAPVTFINNNQSGYILHEWSTSDLGLGVVVDNATNFTYAFPTAGTYDVRLKSTNCNGSSTVTKTITVVAPPVHLFQISLLTKQRLMLSQ
jgi:PKD repeat protein